MPPKFCELCPLRGRVSTRMSAKDSTFICSLNGPTPANFYASILSIWRLHFYPNTRHKVQVPLVHVPDFRTFDRYRTMC